MANEKNAGVSEVNQERKAPITTAPPVSSMTAAEAQNAGRVTAEKAKRDADEARRVEEMKNRPSPPPVVESFGASSGLWLVNRTGRVMRLLREKYDNQAGVWIFEARLGLAQEDATELEVGDGVRTVVEVS